MEGRTKGRVKLHQGSIYPALRSMEKEGLLESCKSEPLAVRGGRPRTYYRLTAEGRRAAYEDREVFAAFGLEPLGAT